jgi:glycerol-3-phosphate dehydrogenase
VAQARWAIEREGALTVGDVLLRRTPAGWSRCLGLDAAATVADLLVGRHRWSETRRREAIAAYEAEVRATFRTPGHPVASVSR